MSVMIKNHSTLTLGWKNSNCINEITFERRCHGEEGKKNWWHVKCKQIFFIYIFYLNLEKFFFFLGKISLTSLWHTNIHAFYLHLQLNFLFLPAFSILSNFSLSPSSCLFPRFFHRTAFCCCCHVLKFDLFTENLLCICFEFICMWRDVAFLRFFFSFIRKSFFIGMKILSNVIKDEILSYNLICPFHFSPLSPSFAFLYSTILFSSEPW